MPIIIIIMCGGGGGIPSPAVSRITPLLRPVTYLFFKYGAETKLNTWMDGWMDERVPLISWQSRGRIVGASAENVSAPTRLKK